MLNNILATLKSLFAVKEEASYLEKYILMNNPQSTLDVEHLEREFAYMQANRRFETTFFNR